MACVMVLHFACGLIMDQSTLGKWITFTGLGMVAFGMLLWVLGKSGLPFGRFPGDIHVQREKFLFYFPIVTCIVISIMLTVLLSIIIRFLRK